MLCLRVLNELMVLDWFCSTIFKRFYGLVLVGDLGELLGPLALR